MVANFTESRIISRTAGWSWWCGLVVNPTEDIFSIRICPLDPEDHMLSQKLLIDISDQFTGRNQLLAA